MENNLALDEFIVRFWGVRGSIPTPGSSTIRYGGNTSCVEMHVGGQRLIFDGGTGLRLLGKNLKPHIEQSTHIFFTHYHWDHIQGVPFFFPVFDEDTHFTIYGQVPNEGEPMKMRQHFCQRVLHLDSPVPIAHINAQIDYHDLVCGEIFKLGDIDIETAPLNHPNGAMGYRISWQGHTAVYCTDTEHLPDRIDENVLSLARDADILIYDAMYTDEEYHNEKSPKVGWGHSTWEEGIRVADAANVKQLVVFHHEPNHSDDLLDEIAIKANKIRPGTVLAREGMELSLTKTAVESH
ncbi:MAG: MBL fold metallo-hydrolase [Jaaginema sp. PMC 1079.18]|nr:MBL fold metallo-hydrolase [Jaaginema sp. PMC 1080.18]MEC4850492.1 MBL fold metallo-hydrolase [Jaaginema sp. PMC 1079.18]MEC4867526.1 MBL fold metallo-hydrolase [Jaaginema sp. PMC 1078.18]